MAMQSALPEPPGPRGFAGLTSLIGFARGPLTFGVRLQRDYGDVVSFRALGIHFVLLSNPDDIERVL